MPITLPLSYSTVDILLTVMPDIGSRTTLTSAQIMNFAGEAQAEVNGAIVKHYALPLTVEVPALQAVTNRIAIYNILALRVFTAERLNASAWPAEYEKAKEWLARISTGEIPLVNASGAVVAPRTDIAEVWSTTMAYNPTHTELDFPYHVTDSDKLESEADKRDFGGVGDRYLK